MKNTRDLLMVVLITLAGAQRAAATDAPVIFVVDPVTTVEGTGSPSIMSFPVRLVSPSSAPVSFDYATSDGTAVAPGDYRAATGTVSFAPGQISSTIPVSIAPDAVAEESEYLAVSFSNFVNCAPVTARPVTGLIVDDDEPVAPSIVIASLQIGRGSTGSRTAALQVSLNQPQPVPVSVRATTFDLTASAGADYLAKDEVLTFAAGETRKPFAVTVFADPSATRTEIFAVRLTEATAPVGIPVGYVHLAVGPSPIVALTAPVDGASFMAPATVRMTADATDPDAAITKVQFSADGQVVGEDASAPYGYDWAGVQPGRYALTATAFNDVGASTTTAPVIVVVDLGTGSNQPPSVSLTSPAASAVFTAPATVELVATASDGDGSIARVEFFVGTTMVGEDATSPYSVTWSNAPAGTYRLSARAVDDQGASASSPDVHVTVVAPNRAPTVALTAPASGLVGTAPATISLAATASDDDGSITRVEFHSGTTKLGEDATSPYTFAWTSVAAGAYDLSATAYDDDGAWSRSPVVTIRVDGFASPFAVTAPASVAPGGEITVSWQAPGGRAATDWIGLYHADEADDHRFLAWVYTQGTPQGRATFTAPAAGTYEFRYFIDDGFVRTAVSAPVRVAAHALSLTAATVRPGDPVTVGWTAPGGSAALDWIGLYRADETDESRFLDWRYTYGAVEGAMTFAAPAWEGIYEFRYLLDDGFVRTAASGTFTVASPSAAQAPARSASTPTAGWSTRPPASRAAASGERSARSSLRSSRLAIEAEHRIDAMTESGRSVIGDGLGVARAREAVRRDVKRVATGCGCLGRSLGCHLARWNRMQTRGGREDQREFRTTSEHIDTVLRRFPEVPTTDQEPHDFACAVGLTAQDGHEALDQVAAWHHRPTAQPRNHQMHDDRVHAPSLPGR